MVPMVRTSHVAGDSPTRLPSRGDVWLADLDPTRGREQRGTRPALVVSTNRFTHGPAELVIVLPITKVARGVASHVALAGVDSGLDHDSFVLCEQVRCVARERLTRRIGRAPDGALARIEVVLRALLEL